MAALPVEIRGTLYDLQTKSSRQVYIVGEAHRSDVGVGGGPILPGGDPPGTWGGAGEPFPTPPIHLPPGSGGSPPVIWGPNDPRPTPPIYLPPDTPPPIDMTPGGEKPPPEGAAGWGYYDGRWGFFPAPTDAGPKS